MMLMLAFYFSLNCHPALANPVGPQVVAGGAQIESAGSVMNIHQTTDRAVINWQGFSIGGQEVTNFLQPSASSAVLNRVTSGEVSQIQGALNANGQVYLINPAGIMIGNGAVVNVGSFIASTANVNDGTFMGGGPLNFVGATEAGIVSKGKIHASTGDVVLMAKTVKNEGLIQAPNGTAGLLAGKEFYLKKEEPGAIGVKVGAGGQAVDAGVDNQGRIEAMRIQLEAQGNVYGLAVNQGGVLMATGVQHKGDGTIVLAAPGGKIRQAGTMLAVNANGSGGRLSVKAGEITVEASSIMTAAGSGATAEAKGGTMEIDAEGDVLLNGRLDVTAGGAAKGGRMVVTGKRVGVLAGTLDASGGTGGGEILVGGDYLGQNPAVKNAEVSVLMPEATIRADATANGDGGRVILWSDEYTGFYGDISVRGGAENGDGGFVETSSSATVQIFGDVNTGADRGKPGLWFIDPDFITIQTVGGAFPAGATSNFFPTPPGTSVIDPRAITRALSVGNLTLSANLDISVLTEIRFQEADGATSYTTLDGATLTLQAGRSVTVTGGIDINSSLVIIANDGNADPGIRIGTIGAGPGGISIASNVTSREGSITLILERLSGGANQFQPGDIAITAPIQASSEGTVSITAESVGSTSITPSGNILLGASISAFDAGILSSVNLTTGVAGQANGGYIEQLGGFIRATNLNATTQNSVLPSLDLGVVGAHNLPWQFSSYIYLGSANNEVTNISLVAVGGQGATGQNNLTTFDPTGLRPTEGFTALFYRDSDGINIGTTRGIITAGSVNIVAGAGGPGGVTQTQPIYATALGVEAVGNVDLPLSDTGLISGLAATGIGNDILYLAGDTRATPTNGAFIFAERNGFNVSYAQTYYGAAWQGENTLLMGIRAGNVFLSSLNGTEANGITLLNEPTYFISTGTQYSLLSELPISFTTRISKPGHIEASRDVTITVGDPDTAAGALDTRFTLDEGIHLFAGMNNGLNGFSGSSQGGDETPDGRGRGIVTITANNMTLGMDTQPGIAMNGLIMTGNINQSTVLDETSGVFLRPYGDGGIPGINPLTGLPGLDPLTGAPFPNFSRPVYLVSPKADYSITPDPGQLQLTSGELQRVNSNRLQVRSAFTDPTDPAVDVRTSLSLNGLYDVTTGIGTGIFPTLAGVNRLELWASGGGDGLGGFGNVQVSADVSSDANLAPMQIYLAATAEDNSSGGTIEINAGLRSYGGYVAIQGDEVNISGAINANNPANATGGRGLVAIFPGTGPTAAAATVTARPMNLGTKATGALGILSSELALITAGTIQIGLSANTPMVLRPTSNVTGTFLAGAPSIWTVGNPFSLEGLATGTLEVTDLISGLSADTLVLMADNASGQGLGGQSNVAMRQSSGAGIRVGGLLIAGTPGTFDPVLGPESAPGTDYILNSTLNSFDRLGVALTTNIDQDAGAGRSGTPTGDLLIVNSKGFTGGNSGEVARTSQQWWQSLIRANANTSPLYTGIGLVAARALSITAAGPVAIYETLPTGVTGVGQYMAHVNANPTDPVTMDRTEVGNQIGVLGGSGTTVGLAVDARQNTLGAAGANAVWVAAARGLAISDLDDGVFSLETGLAGILTAGGQVTLEGNAIEINPTVTRAGGNNITIDTTGASSSAATSQLATSGARVVIRPATGENGFQDVLGSGAYDPLLENSVRAGAPVEINLGTDSATGSGLPAPFLNASLDTLFLGAAALAGSTIRANALEIGRQGVAGTAAGKITVTDNLIFSSLAKSLTLLSRGAVEDQNMISGSTPYTITMNLNGTPGSGGLAVRSGGAVALRGNVSIFAANATANNNVRFIDTAGGISIGVVDGLSGITANTVYLDAVNGGIAQASGATISAATGGLSLQANGPIRLDQANNFNLVATDAGNNAVYLRSTGPMTVTSFPDGQPGAQPGAVTGIIGGNVTLVAGGSLNQDGNAPIQATGSFLALVADGFDILLNSFSNQLGSAPILGAQTSTGSLGRVRNLTVINQDGITLGSAGVVNIGLTSTGTGWTQRPGVTISPPTSGGTPASAEAIMGLATIQLSDRGEGYQGAPEVIITDANGSGAIAVADVDLDPSSLRYGQVLRVRVTNPGTGYGVTGPVAVAFSGGNPTKSASVKTGDVTLNLQRINVVNPGAGYQTATVTVQNTEQTITATATPLLAGTGGYVPSSTVLGGITGNLYASTGTASGGGAEIVQNGASSGFAVGGTSTFISNQAINLPSALNSLTGAVSVASNGNVTLRNTQALLLGNFSSMNLPSGLPITGGIMAGTLTLGSKVSVTQPSPASSVRVGGTASFYATATAAEGGTPTGPVVLANAENIFNGTVNAEGSRVVIRQTESLTLGKVVAPISLTANSTGTGKSITVTESLNTGSVSLDASGSVTTSGATLTVVSTLDVISGGNISLGIVNQTGELAAGNQPAATISSSGGTVTFNGAANFVSGLEVEAQTSIEVASGGSLTVGTADPPVGEPAAAASFETAAGSINLGANTTFYGDVSLTTGGGGGTFSSNESLNLGTINLGAGSLVVTAAGNITQVGTITAGNVSLTVTSPPQILALSAAGTLVDILLTQDNNISGSVTLNNPQIIRDFKFKNISAGAGTITGLGNGITTNLRDLTIIYNNAAYEVPSLTMASLRNISVTTGGANGAITQAGAIVQGLAGSVTMTSTGTLASIILNSSNDFKGPVSLNNSGASIVAVTDVNAITLGTSSVGTGTFTVNAVGIGQTGVITQAAGAGAATFNGGAGAITLTQANQFTGPVSLNNSGLFDVAVTDANDITLGTSSVGTGTLTVNAVGISQTGIITQAAGAGAASFNAGAGAITLDNSENNFTGVLGLDNSGSDDVAVNDEDGVVLGSVTVGGDLTIEAGTSIDDDLSARITVGGSASFTAGTNLDLQTLYVTGPISLDVNGNATVINNLATVVGSASSIVGGSFNLTSRGGISQTGVLNVNGSTLLNAAGAINLGLANELQGQVTISSASSVSLANNAPGAGNAALFPILPIGLQDLMLSFGDSELSLPELSINGNLNLTASGNFAQTGLLTVGGTGSSSITSTAGSVTFSQASQFAGGLTVGVAAGSFVQNGGTLITGSTLSVTAGTFIQQVAGALEVRAGGANFAAGDGQDISLEGNGNQFAGTVSFLGNPGNVAITDQGFLELAGMTLSGTLTARGDGIQGSGIFIVPGLTTLTAGTKDIRLIGSNSFEDVRVISAQDVFLGNTLGRVTVANARDVFLTNDSLTPLFPVFPTLAGSLIRNLSLTFPNLTELPALAIAGNLSLSTQGNVIQSGVLDAGGAGTIDSTGGTVAFHGASRFGDTLTVTAGANPGGVTISQLVGSVIQVGKTSSFQVEAGNDIALLGANQFGGAVTLGTLSGAGQLGNVTVRTVAPIELGALDISADLQLTGIGGITQSGRFRVGGETTLDAGTGAIQLAGANEFAGEVSVLSASSVAIANLGNLSLGSIALAPGLNVPLFLESREGVFTLSRDLTASGDVTLNGKLGVVLNGNINTGGGNLQIDNLSRSAISLGQNITLQTSGGEVVFGGAVVGNSHSLEIEAGGGDVEFQRAVGGLAQVNILSAGNVTAAKVTADPLAEFEAETITLGAGITGMVDFQTILNLTSALDTSAGGVYGVTIAQSPNSIGQPGVPTVFSNTGEVILGEADAVNFRGGLEATAPSKVILKGNIRSESGDIVLGTATKPVEIQSSRDVAITPVGGKIVLGGILGAAQRLILRTDALQAVEVLGDATLPGGFSITTDSLSFAGSLRSTGGGTIDIQPRTGGRGVRLGGGSADGALSLGSLLARTFTTGRVEIGSAATGAITVAGSTDASANGFGRLVLQNDSGNLDFQANGQLLLPQGTTVDVNVAGDVVGWFDANQVNLSLSAPGGRLNLLAAGTVTLGTDVGTMGAGSDLNPVNGFVLVNRSGLGVEGRYITGQNADLLIQALAGNIQIQEGSFFQGQDLTIAPAGNFYNLAGPNPFANTADGRTVVYAYQSNLNRPTGTDAGLTGFEWTFRTPQIIGNYAFGSYTIDSSEIPSGNAVVYAGNPVIPDLTMVPGLVEGFVNTSSYVDSVPTLGYPMPRAYEGAIRLGFSRSGLTQKNASASGMAGENPPTRRQERNLEVSPERLRLRDVTEDRPALSDGEKVGQQEASPGRLKVGRVPRSAAPEAKSAETTSPAPNLRESQASPVSLRFSEEYLPFEVRPVTEASGKVSDRR